MQTKDVLEQLKIGLSAKLGPGYKAKTNATYKNIRHEKAFAGGKMVVSQNVAVYSGSFSIYLSLMVHHDAIEDLYGKALGLSTKEIALRGSIFLNQSSYHDKPLHGFQVHTDADVALWIDLIAAYIEEKGRPFWEQFNTLEKIDAVVNSNLNQELPWFADQRFRAEYGIVAAKVNRHPSYSSVLEAYRVALQDREDFALFELVVNALEQV